MTAHSRAIVPIEAWAYAAPEVRASGKTIDLGLFSEALIYYDTVLLNPTTQRHVAELLERTLDRREFSLLRGLIYDGIVEIYEYSFTPAPVYDPRDDTYRLLNIQDEAMAQPNSFPARYLWHPSVVEVMPAVQISQLEAALAEHTTEVKGEDFGLAIQDAARLFQSPLRSSLIVQRFVDELYRYRNLGPPPAVSAQVLSRPQGGESITWNINFDQLSAQAGESVGFHRGSPIAASATSTRLLWSAAQTGCDLFLPPPLSSVAGDKLAEGIAEAPSPSDTLANLKEFASFPDLRRAVNDGDLGLRDVLRIRRKARRFRRWLQQPGDRDIDAFASYHAELSKQSLLERCGRKSVSLFGMIGGAGVGLMVDGTLGAGLGTATAYVGELASRIGAGWRPIVFGEWLDSRLAAAVRKRDAS